MATETLYSIKWEYGDEFCYYVGKTRKYNTRMEQHLEGRGAACIKKLKGDPITTSLSSHDDATWAETKTTLELMQKHGVNRVRGAEYCKPTEYTKEEVENIVWAVVHHNRIRPEDAREGLLKGPFSNGNTFFGNNCLPHSSTRTAAAGGAAARSPPVTAVPASPQGTLFQRESILSQQFLSGFSSLGLETADIASPSRASSSSFSHKATADIASPSRAPAASASRVTRRCKYCQADISSRPANHKLCLSCWQDRREFLNKPVLNIFL